MTGTRTGPKYDVLWIVRAYQRQVWAGASETDADRIITEYGKLGIIARKQRYRRGEK